MKSKNIIEDKNIIKENRKTEERIYGYDTHIVEGIIRASWLAGNDESLELWAR